MANEEVLKGISKILTEDSLNKKRMAEFSKGNVGNQKYAGAEINETNRHITFSNDFIQDDYFMRKLPQILDYVHNQGYTTNLDKKEK